MIEVVIDSVRVSLMSQHRIVVLKDTTAERFLPIWIGPCEADAITMELQDMAPQRPLTHDLLKTVIRELGGRVLYVLVADLRTDVFYARIVIDVKGQQVEVDSRTSDAIALAVRVKVPIYVAEMVMDKAAVEPDENVEQGALRDADSESARSGAVAPADEVDDTRLSAFKDFVDSLDLDDIDEDD